MEQQALPSKSQFASATITPSPLNTTLTTNSGDKLFQACPRAFDSTLYYPPPELSLKQRNYLEYYEKIVAEPRVQQNDYLKQQHINHHFQVVRKPAIESNADNEPQQIFQNKSLHKSKKLHPTDYIHSEHPLIQQRFIPHLKVHPVYSNRPTQAPQDIVIEPANYQHSKLSKIKHLSRTIQKWEINNIIQKRKLYKSNNARKLANDTLALSIKNSQILHTSNSVGQLPAVLAKFQQNQAEEAVSSPVARFSRKENTLTRSANLSRKNTAIQIDTPQKIRLQAQPCTQELNLAVKSSAFSTSTTLCKSVNISMGDLNLSKPSTTYGNRLTTFNSFNKESGSRKVGRNYKLHQKSSTGIGFSLGFEDQGTKKQSCSVYKPVVVRNNIAYSKCSELQKQNAKFYL